MLDRRVEFARGWRVLLACVMGGGTGVAVLQAYSLSALIGPLSESLGWSRARISAAPLFYALATILAAPVAGALADRFGARRVAAASQIMLALCFAAIAHMAADIRLFYAGYALLAILGGGTLPMIWSRAITGWFVAGRGLALGLSLFGTGIIGAMLPTYVSLLVLQAGWRGAYLGLAILPLVLGLPVALMLFRDPPGEHRVAASQSSGEYRFLGAIRTRCFWQMCLCFLLAALAVSGVLVHALPMLVDRGVARGTAAALAGLFGLAVTFGRLASGYLLDVFRGPTVAAFIFALAAGACCVLAVSGASLAAGGVGIVCVGLAAGAEADIGAYFIARYFGRHDYGAIYGLLYAVYNLGGGLGPPLAGAIFDASGSYRTALYGGGTALLLAAVLAGTLRPPPLRS